MAKVNLLRIENELKEKMLKQEFCAKYFTSRDSSECQLDLEKCFLKYIEHCEKELEEIESRTVHEIIGNISFVKGKDIPDSDICHELEQLINTLNKNNIYIETLFDIEAKVLYNFITEELLKHEIFAIKGEGFNWHFVYEDFHPNHAYNIRINCEDFILSFLETNNENYKTYLLFDSGYNKKLFSFKNAFDSFDLKRLDIENIGFDKTLGLVEFSADIYGTFDNTCEAQRFYGKGSMALVCEDGFWYVYWVKFPGVEI